ncbi:sigma-70 family RNA polymerase sigma factor [Bryobacter aggregatus]|uniref:sigma-70 family RNA polymerase sigma factor n=1 Tax=Bryobacter aggregatus TaxID=360054 RepID=UPI0009B5AE1B
MSDLYDRYSRVVFSIILRIVRDASVAEELAQETFLRAWTRATEFDAGRGRIGPWLLTIARNRAIDYLRSSAGQQQANTFELVSSERLTLFVHTEDRMLEQEQARRIRSAFSKLTENQRAVLELAYFEGLSQSEMANKLGQPLGTVKTWVRTALSTLRESFHVA